MWCYVGPPVCQGRWGGGGGREEGEKEGEGGRGGPRIFPSSPFLSRRLPPGLLRDFNVTDKPIPVINDITPYYQPLYGKWTREKRRLEPQVDLVQASVWRLRRSSGARKQEVVAHGSSTVIWQKTVFIVLLTSSSFHFTTFCEVFI